MVDLREKYGKEFYEILNDAYANIWELDQKALLAEGALNDAKKHLTECQTALKMAKKNLRKDIGTFFWCAIAKMPRLTELKRISTDLQNYISMYEEMKKAKLLTLNASAELDILRNQITLLEAEKADVEKFSEVQLEEVKKAEAISEEDVVEEENLSDN